MNESLIAMAWVAGGSALGGMARYWLSGTVGRWIGETFPWGTLAVNVTGAFAIGVVAAVAAAGTLAAWQPEAWLLAVVGFLGSYTTVSSFSLQTLALARAGQPWRAGGNILMSVGLCLSAAAAGFLSGQAVFS